MKRCFSVQKSSRIVRGKRPGKLQLVSAIIPPSSSMFGVTEHCGWVGSFTCYLWGKMARLGGAASLPQDISVQPSLSLSHQLPCHGLLFLLEIMQVISLRRSVINSLMMEHITIKCGEAMQGSTLTEPPSPVRFTQTKADFSCPKLSVPSEAQGGSLLSLIVTQILPSGPSVQPCRLPGDVQLTGIEGICKSFSGGTVWQEWAHGILHLLHNILLLLLGRTQLCCLNFWAGAKYSEGKYQLN